MKSMSLGQKGIDLIKEFEGYHKALKDGSCVAYLDTLPRKELWSPGYKGLWTIGWGSVGPDITEGTHWTMEIAQARMIKEADKKGQQILAYLGDEVELNQNEYDALVSLAYNLGVVGIHKILDDIKAGNRKAAADRMLKYNKAGKKVYNGLVRRRKAERTVFLWEPKHEVYAASSKLKISVWTRIATAITTAFSTAIAYVGSYLNWDMLKQVKEFATDNQALILLGVAGSFLIVMKIIENKTVQDFDQDRYVPSSMGMEGKVKWEGETE